MINRAITPATKKLLQQYPVITITGPRQSGKTTLARMTFPGMQYYNLEDIETRTYASDDPVGFLNNCEGGAIIDEFQHVPDLASYIQARIEKERKESMYVLTGSIQFELMETVNQSLAGRTAILRLLPFSIAELNARYPDLTIDEFIFRGFYPRIYDKNLDPVQALSDYYTTYVERDIRRITAIHNLSLFQKFVRLCAGRIGQILNFSSLASDTGISHTTAREWMSILQASFIVMLLEPYYVNTGKRLIKSPKLYFYDVGLASRLLGIENPNHVSSHPLRGNLFENLALMEILKYRFNHVSPNNIFFFRDSKGNEIDIFYTSGNAIIPIEIKAGETINSDYFKGFLYLDKNLNFTVPLKILIYSGDRNVKQSDVTICNVKNIAAVISEYEKHT